MNIPRSRADAQTSGPAKRENPFRATKIWNLLVEHVRSEVRTKRRRWKLQYFDDCFRGCDIVRVLQSYVDNSPQMFKDVSRSQLRSFCQVLQDRNVIKPVQNASAKEENFEDGNRLYRFVEEVKEECEKACDKRRRTRSCDRVLRPIHGNSNRNLTEKRKRLTRRRSADDFLQNGLHEMQPLKKRRRSLDPEASIRKPRTLPQIPLTAKDIVEVIYQRICLCNLLRLLDVSFLEEILEGLATRECFLNGHTSVFTAADQATFEQELSPLLNEEVSKGQKSIQNHLCVIARSCFMVQRKFPLGNNSALGFPNLAHFTRSEVVQILNDHFVSIEDPLIPVNLTTLLDGVIGLYHSAKLKQTRQALQLLLVLIPLHNRKHLEQLLRFIKFTHSHGRVVVPSGFGKCFFVSRFMGVIIPSQVRDKGKAMELVAFMVRERERIFLVPHDIKKEGTRQCCFLQIGNDWSSPRMASSACHQITLAEYANQKQHFTTECLSSLMNHIIEDVNLSLKEKEKKVSMFQMHYPEIFLQQFPDGKF